MQIIAVIATTAPIDISIPAVISTSVKPMAMMPVSDAS